MWQAIVLEHSLAGNGKELLTGQLRYPRFIHAEAKTHRILSQSGQEYEQVILTQDDSFMSDRAISRNASSSRAIPVAKMIEQVRSNPAMPVHWGTNKPGMQAGAELEGADLIEAKQAWRDLAAAAADGVERMLKVNLHKQVSNRPLEPYQWISVVATATEWDGFFELRDHDAADPNIHFLASMMKGAIAASTPILLGSDPSTADGWHLPYVSESEREKFFHNPRLLARVSAARCARVSFLNHDKSSPIIEKDLELCDMLVGSRPLHASPVEHQAYAAPSADVQSGNFFGFIQHRKLIEAGQ